MYNEARHLKAPATWLENFVEILRYRCTLYQFYLQNWFRTAPKAFAQRVYAALKPILFLELILVANVAPATCFYFPQVAVSEPILRMVRF